ncbi:MAG: LptF/LptG family permease [Fimbriimonas sp.]
MRLLDRYVLRELFVPFLIGTLGVVMMFLANEYIALAKNLELQHVPVSAIAQYLICKTPFYTYMTLPIGTALAASMAMSRLVRESELTAIRGAGARILRVILPVALFGLAVGGLNLYLVERVIPPANRRANTLAQQVGLLALAPTFKANTVLYLRRYTATFASVTRSGEQNLDINDVLLIERPQAGITQIISAKRGTYNNGVWELFDSYLWRVRGQDLLIARPNGQFTINERIVIDDFFSPPAPEEQTIQELHVAIESGRRMGADTRRLEVAYQVKFSVPAACMIFALVAPVFAIVFARSGAFVGVLLSIVMVMLYYNAFIISTQILGKLDAVSPIMAAWLPNLLFFLLGIFAIRRLE